MTHAGEKPKTKLQDDNEKEQTFVFKVIQMCISDNRLQSHTTIYNRKKVVMSLMS